MRPTEPKQAAPVIFIHYGPASYLRQTLGCARKANPDKRIVLLGDKSNRRFATGAAEFFPFEEFSSGAKHARFRKVFQVIQGERHRFTKHGGMDVWLEFVFRRWFLIEDFLVREQIDSFWTFDSDTLLLAPLGPREARFYDVEATTQCRGECLNGWVGSADLVARYTSCILDLFGDKKFLDAQRERLKIHVGLAFNEMDAFSYFREREGVRTRQAASVIAGEAFDDALAFVENYEPAPVEMPGRTAVKRLWASPHGGIWARTGGNYVRLLTCNMSWMPEFLWKTILGSAKVGHPVGLVAPPSVPDLRPIDLSEPFMSRMIRLVSVLFWRVRGALMKCMSRTEFSPASKKPV